MDSQELGKRLKDARIAKKMTQSQVVGDFITRNMLSQIESGIATPSIKTLEYLAGVLEISLASLIPSDDTLGANASEAAVITKAKAAIASGDYEGALKIMEASCTAFADEVYALRSIAYFALASSASKNGDLQNAVDYAKYAHEYSGMGIYANAERAEESLRLMNKSAKLLSDYYASMITE